MSPSVSGSQWLQPSPHHTLLPGPVAKTAVQSGWWRENVWKDGRTRRSLASPSGVGSTPWGVAWPCPCLRPEAGEGPAPAGRPALWAIPTQTEGCLGPCRLTWSVCPVGLRHAPQAAQNVTVSRDGSLEWAVTRSDQGPPSKLPRKTMSNRTVVINSMSSKHF